MSLQRSCSACLSAACACDCADMTATRWWQLDHVSAGRAATAGSRTPSPKVTADKLTKSKSNNQSINADGEFSFVFRQLAGITSANLRSEPSPFRTWRALGGASTSRFAAASPISIRLVSFGADRYFLLYRGYGFSSCSVSSSTIYRNLVLDSLTGVMMTSY